MSTDASEPLVRRPRLSEALAEAAAMISAQPEEPVKSADLPKGDGHAVLVLPALFRGDPYTAEVRDFLANLGYSTFGWDLGTNIGPTRRLLQGSSNRLVELSNLYGKVSVVGFSLGGLFARWLSLRMPERVRQVITVCSPIQEPAKNFWIPLEPFLDLWPDGDLRQLAKEVAQPLPVPGTFLFSPEDGIVNSAACRDEAAAPEDNIQISGPHVLIARSKEVRMILAKRLARTLPHTA